MRGDQLNVEQQLVHFRQYELSRFQPVVNGMDVFVRNFGVKDLPRICFDMYSGGKDAMMKRRRRLRDADPRRQEAKRLARLAELKSRMAEMQRRKDELAAAENKAKKRKREEDQDEGALMKEEEGEGARMETEDRDAGETAENRGSAVSGDGQEVEEEEEELLEHALDAIQTVAGAAGTVKTREEAAEDRKKLLAGELLEEGGGGELGEENEDDFDTDYLGQDTLLPAAAAHQKPKTAAEVALTVAEAESEVLRRAGYTVISDDEVTVIGGNIVQPWRQRPSRAAGGSGKVGESERINGLVEIRFKTKFDVVELDANGFVVDKGDADFKPSKGWTGRRPGFEFKLGERGLGYYRTGKKVVVPSNTAYSY